MIKIKDFSNVRIDIIQEAEIKGDGLKSVTELEACKLSDLEDKIRLD